MKNKKIISLCLAFSLILSLFSGCSSKKQPTVVEKPEQIKLVYYRMFDDEDVIRPIIQQYESTHPNVKIVYKKFNDLDEYLNLIINELAEGQGPDIFSAPNYWILPNIKKLSPADLEFVSPQAFRDVFVNVAGDDLIFLDPADNTEKVFGLPMMVDTLALYYNKSVYEDKIPSRGKPPTTWAELEDDVYLLTKKDQSFERFEQAGIAMGRFDNIARSIDILYLLMIQNGTKFYNENMSKAEFSRQRSDSIGLGASASSPAGVALDIFTSFALPSKKNYSWNQYISDSSSPAKELEAFARGKVVMIFGYSYLYEQLASLIKDLEGKGVKTISMNNVGISVVPQIVDPQVSTEKRDTYANYFVETVSRTSDHSKEAWDFLVFITNKENLDHYNQKTKRPTSRRDMIEDQKKDPVYGVFAEQIGFAESLPIYDFYKYNSIFGNAVESVLGTKSINDSIRTAEDEINKILPSGGMIIPPSAVNIK